MQPLALLALRPLAAAIASIVLISNSTATSAVFLAYRTQWGLTTGQLGVVFSLYVLGLIPALLAASRLAVRAGRARVILIGMLFMLAGTAMLVLAHALPLLLVARFFQGLGAGLAGGILSALFTESYRGRLNAASVLQAVIATGLFAGPVITAIAFDLGGGTNRSYVPILILGIVTLAFAPLFAESQQQPSANAAAELPYRPVVVARALRFALPLGFVSWAGLSLYLALVPAYLATALHAHDPLIGAAAVVGAQLASIAATLRLGHIAPERRGIVAPVVMVAGLILLVAGTSTNTWPAIVLATILVGAGGGVASSAAFAMSARVGRGQRTRVISQLMVASYLGYSVPALATGLIAARSSLTVGFTVDIVLLALITAALPLLRAKVCEECPPVGSLAPAA
jgi:MFS family permease